MKGGAKRVLIGVAVIVGLQLVLAILIRLYAAAIAQAQVEPLVAGQQFNMLFLGISLGTFFIGGLIIGFMEDRVVLGEPVLAALIAMMLTTLTAFLGLPETVFLASFAKAGAWGSLIMTVAVGIIATVGGGLIGERIRVPTEDDPLARAAVAVGLALVITGPFFLLMLPPYNLPWSVVVTAVLIVLVLVGVAYYMFTRGETFEKSIEEISISPERRRES